MMQQTVAHPGELDTRVGPRKRQPLNALNRGDGLAARLFIAPTYLGFLLFVAGPLVASLVLAFTSYDVLTPPQWVGLDNFRELLEDDRLKVTFGNTIFYVAAATILINVCALILAILINRNLPKMIQTLLRSLFFFPSLVGLVYISVIWQALFQKDTGIVNYYLSFVHPEASIDWLNSYSLSKFTVVFVDLWRNVGFALLIYLAALQSVPQELLEAADVDGASALTKQRRIVIPLITPSIFFNVTMTIIGSFQIYESIIVLTGGGPDDSSRSIVMYIAEIAFQQYRLGYASAIATILFVLVLIATGLQFALRRKWVFDAH